MNASAATLTLMLTPLVGCLEAIKRALDITFKAH